MAIQLAKKQSFDLTKRGATKILVGLSWEQTVAGSAPVDCDASVVMLAANHKFPDEGSFVFYNNLLSTDGAVRHFGDSRDGAADGDDEVIEINLPNVSAAVEQMLFVVTIHEAAARRHNFGNVPSASIRIYKDAEELCNYTMADGVAADDSVIIGSMQRSGAEWAFTSLGQGFSGGLQTIIDLYNA